MVQGDRTNVKSSYGLLERERDSKRSGFENLQKREQEKNNKLVATTTEKKAQESNKYGAWGSTFKNQQNFKGMHNC